MTSFDTNYDALLGVLNVWSSSRSYATRIANLSGTGSGARANGSYFLKKGTTVFDDGKCDQLTGASGCDWFFGSSSEDPITDRQSSERLH